MIFSTICFEGLKSDVYDHSKRINTQVGPTNQMDSPIQGAQKDYGLDRNFTTICFEGLEDQMPMIIRIGRNTPSNNAGL